MRLTTNPERPSALPAVCAQVSNLSGSLAALSLAHVSYLGIGTEGKVDLAGLAQQITVWQTPIDMINGFNAKAAPTAKRAVVAVSGVPPRGRPV